MENPFFHGMRIPFLSEKRLGKFPEAARIYATHHMPGEDKKATDARRLNRLMHETVTCAEKFTSNIPTIVQPLPGETLKKCIEQSDELHAWIDYTRKTIDEGYNAHAAHVLNENVTVINDSLRYRLKKGDMLNPGLFASKITEYGQASQSVLIQEIGLYFGHKIQQRKTDLSWFDENKASPSFSARKSRSHQNYAINRIEFPWAG